MFPSSSGSFGTGPSVGRKGVTISLETFNEWKIQEIGYNGVEKYIRPESFSDHVGKLARQVEWHKLVGTDAVYDNPSLANDDSEEEQVKEKKPRVDIKERSVPDAGPWHGVAKNLHESLQQLNVLLDNLAIMRSTDYMKPLTVLDPIYMEAATLQTESAASSKAAQWVWKRKALSEAMNVLELAQRQRNMEVEDKIHQQKSQFFVELTKMREYWRVRKTGDHIYGDLGYHIFGSKYHPRELFDISRRSVPIVNSPTEGAVSVLQVTVPRDLTRRSTLSISVVKDEHTTRSLFGSLDDTQFEYMKVDSKKVENVYWENALKWAQETLICKDTFNTLCCDAVQLRSRLSIVRDGVLLVSLHDNLLLRIELKYHPFKEGDIPEEGDPYLNRSLRQMVVAQECTRWVRPQLFVSLPVTNLAEALDSRGPKAFTQKEIDDRAHKPQFMLEKLLAVAAHFCLVKIVRETLEAFMRDRKDPQIHWRWLRCSPTNSQFMVIMTNRNFDFVVGKVTYYIRVSSDSICMVSKDGHNMDCHRDRGQLLYALKYMTCTFSVTSIASMGKMLWYYQIMHANMNAVDETGQPAPTLYLCNAAATISIFLQFGINRNPIIKVRKFVADTKDGNDEEKQFVTLNYDRLKGSTLCKKMDNLFAVLRDTD